MLLQCTVDTAQELELYCVASTSPILLIPVKRTSTCEHVICTRSMTTAATLQVIYAIKKTGVVDALGTGRKSADELAKELGVPLRSASLGRVLVGAGSYTGASAPCACSSVSALLLDSRKWQPASSVHFAGWQSWQLILCWLCFHNTACVKSSVRHQLPFMHLGIGPGACAAAALAPLCQGRRPWLRCKRPLCHYPEESSAS